MLKRFLFALALASGLAMVTEAQIAVPNTLISGHTIASADLNTNFSTIANHALDRLSGGNISGNVTADPGITIDGVDIGATVCPTCAPTFKDLTLSSPATGIMVAGNNIVNNTGKIPELTATYFSSVAFDSANLTGTAAAINGSNITALNATNLASGTVASARLGSGSATNQNFLRGDGTWAASWTVITTTATGNQNDFAPGIVGNTIIRCNNATALTITGFGGGPNYDGQRVQFISIGAGQVDFAHQSVSSTAANRMINIATSAATSLAAGVGTAEYIYDSTTSRWRLVAHEQGQPITATYAGGNFTGNGSMTWTVDSGDIGTMTYYLHGRMLTVDFYLSNTSVGGTPNTLLQIGNGAWGGYLGAKSTITGFGYIDNGAAQTPGTLQVTTTTSIGLLRAATAVWTASTNNTLVGGSVSFEVQ